MPSLSLSGDTTTARVAPSPVLAGGNVKPSPSPYIVTPSSCFAGFTRVHDFARHRVGAGIVLRLSGVNRWRHTAVHAASPVRILPRGDRTGGCPVQYCQTVIRQIATRNDIGYTSGRGDQGISTQRNRTVLRHRRQVGDSSETC